MSIISVLPDLLINKIAAGEVIERPAAVVRELIDNAIDSGATRIDLEILHGGKKLIKVSDNGSGMSRDDALLSFERHATSKIDSEEDLFEINTMGFRGEALPAIASVSKVTMLTAQKDSSCGTMIEIGADQRKIISDAPPIKGTSVEIRDLFYNTPARKKFLKTNPTELSHIIETVVQKALAFPLIGFTLINNGKETLNAPATDNPGERISQLYGREISEGLIKIERSSKSLQVSGFISRPEMARGARSQQKIFVNSRPVRNPTVNHAVYSAFAGMLSREKHPVYFLFIEVAPDNVDVNVHPAKLEVRFERPDEIHRFVRAAAYEALNPGVEVDTSSTDESPARPSGTYGGFSGYSQPPGSAPEVRESAFEASVTVQSDFFSSAPSEEFTQYFYIGEAFLASADKAGLIIIDQHAAHERIMYEKYLIKAEINPEPLFLPIRVELPVKEYNLLITRKDLLAGLGLDIEDFGGNSILVRALPRELARADMKDLLMDVAAGIIEEESLGIESGLSEDTLMKSIAARLACHQSVRGGQQLTQSEIVKMMKDLDNADEPEKCPHGRPTRIRLSMDDLKKMFKRK